LFLHSLSLSLARLALYIRRHMTAKGDGACERTTTTGRLRRDSVVVLVRQAKPKSRSVSSLSRATRPISFRIANAP
jgi:hypothetical protein